MKVIGEHGEPPGVPELRERASRLKAEWQRAYVELRGAVQELEEYEEASREWVKTGMTNGIAWAPSQAARERWK